MKKLMKVLSLFLICIVAIMSLPTIIFAANIEGSLNTPEEGWQRYKYNCGQVQYYGGKWGFDSRHSSTYVSP